MKQIKSIEATIKSKSLLGLIDAIRQLEYLANNRQSGKGFGTDHSFTIKVVTKKVKS